MLAALGLSPLLQWTTGTPPASLALAGLNPGVTALFTVGWLLGCGGRWWLWPIPLMWMLMELAIGLGLGYIPAMFPLPVAIAVLIMHLRTRAAVDKSIR